MFLFSGCVITVERGHSNTLYKMGKNGNCGKCLECRGYEHERQKLIAKLPFNISVIISSVSFNCLKETSLMEMM